MPKKYNTHPYKLSQDSRPTLHPTKNDLDSSIRIKSINCLNLTLASCSDLKSHAKQAHWMVKGKDYFQLHKLFDELAGELDDFVDTLAERIAALGGTVLGTNKDSSKDSLLPPYPSSITSGEAHLSTLSTHYAMFGKHVREHIKMMEDNQDLGTMDIYTELSLLIDKRLWFIESHLL